MQIPIISGIYTDPDGRVRTSYPVNLIPVPTQSGVSAGYLRPGYGLVSQGAGVGIDRGGIEWRGVLYRVQGTSLVRIDASGAASVLGDVGGGGWCSFDYSTDRMSIASGGRLYYWDGATLTQVTDGDLGTVLDQLWVDGYFMTTDGAYLVVTELTNPTAVNPLKYGSSEVDPDDIKGLLKLRNEVWALNRHTCEVFNNVGGDLFPFQRIEGAQVQKGVIGTHAKCIYADSVAFLGSGRNEPPAVYLASSGSVAKISTQEVDEIIGQFPETQLAYVVLEAKQDNSNNHLYIHLPDRTMVFDIEATKAVGAPVWFTLTSSSHGFAQYQAKGHVWCYDRWNMANPASGQYGYLSDAVSSHWGQHVRWEFGTQIIYNEGQGAIIHNLEIVPLSGHVAMGDSPTISTSHSVDGEMWSTPRSISAGLIGQRVKRLVWLRCGMMRNWRIQRFMGDSRSHLSILRLNVEVEQLVY